MIRQAISCDICGTEMLNANHWFVAREKGTELRIGAWDGKNRLRGATRHLCGQKCLHKLVDAFMARALNATPASAVEKPAAPIALSHFTDSSLIAPSMRPAKPQPIIGPDLSESESIARLLAPARAFPDRATPHRLHADAWKRERERQQRAAGRSIA